jgi:hypothetical protein
MRRNDELPAFNGANAMTVISILILACLFYSLAERLTRGWSCKRVGGITFIRAGRLNVGYSLSRRER